MPQNVALRILLVDDNHSLLRATQTLFERRGWSVTTAKDGLEAKENVRAGTFDVIVSDINMPGYGGLEFLRNVRERDLDVPVILMTGNPSVESSARALEYGAFRYLIKPVAHDKLLDVAEQANRLHELARLKRQAMSLPGSEDVQMREGAALAIRFARSLELMWVAFQPIVSWSERSIFGSEALLRSDDPSMNNPEEILEAAERLGSVHDLGRTVRAKIAAAAQVDQTSALFVNLHPSDLTDPELYSATAPLSLIARRVVLEITERASLNDVKDVTARVARLKAMGFRIAIDDLGAGYAGLSSFMLLEPEIAKFDMSLVRGINADSRRQSIVRSMKKLCDELGILVVAEGVETIEERDMLVSLGCNLFQGYLFAKPGRGFPAPKW